MQDTVATLVKKWWYQFDLLPEDVNEICAACGKSGEMCRGQLAISRMSGQPSLCCGVCKHIFGMVHRNSGETAPPFDSPEAKRMLAEVTELNESGRRREIGAAIRRCRQEWQQRQQDALG